jgi:AcrR family transcriptional regulator
LNQHNGTQAKWLDRKTGAWTAYLELQPDRARQSGIRLDTAALHLHRCIIAQVQNDSAAYTAKVNEPEPGLRERKKRRTRQALIDAAFRLYREKGLEGVTVAEIARVADVAPRTFFGYFESKEDVFLGRGDDRLELLVEAIQERDRREPILTAIRRALQQDRQPPLEASRTGRPELSELLQHPAIANRLRERWNRWEDLLASAIAADVGAGPGDPEPRVVAAAVAGAIRVAAAAAQEQPDRRFEVARRVFDLLASGLAGYGASR